VNVSSLLFSRIEAYPGAIHELQQEVHAYVYKNVLHS
jgi:hypothetical protein